MDSSAETAMQKTESSKFERFLPWITLGALVLGIVFGLLLPRAAESISFLGTAYVSLLKLLIVPLLMCQIFVTTSKNGVKTGRVLLRTILLFALMFAVTFLLTALLTGLIRPGSSYVLPEEAYEGASADIGAEGIFANLISDNIFSSMTSGKLFPCVLFSLLCGLAASILKAERLTAVMEDLSAVFSKLLQWLMFLTPIGVFSLMATATVQNGISVLKTAGGYILFAWGCCIVALILVMILPAWIFCKVRPSRYIRAMIHVWTVSLSTCSSMATLPVTMRTCEEEFHVPDRITSIVVPLGCTIHMCGGAVSFCLLSMFTMQAAGVPLTLGLFLDMLVMAEIINMAAPGIPGGGIAIGAAYLSGLGLPLGFMGIYSGIYRLLDMAYTTLNVTGDVTANLLLSKAEEDKNA